MPEQQHPLATSSPPMRWKTPLWASFLAWVAACWFFGWFALAAGDLGYETKDVPGIIRDAVGAILIVATIELVRAIRRRLWREPDNWIDPTAPGVSKTWALTALLTAVFEVAGLYLPGAPSQTGSVDNFFKLELGAPFWAAFIVWMWFAPRPRPRGVGFYSLYGVGLLTAAAFFVVQIVIHPALIPSFWASVDSTGAFIQALVTGRRPGGT